MRRTERAGRALRQSIVTHDDVFDALDMIEHVLEELYGKTRAKIMAKTKLIEKRMGSLKRK